MNIIHTRAPCRLLICALVLLILCCLLTAPTIGITEAAFNTAGDALIVKEVTGQSWMQLSQLNIFGQDSSENKVIAPTSSGSYTFTIENSARYPFIYTVMISDENIAQIPMQFRLRNHEGDFIIGSESEWVSITDLEGITGELPYQSSTDYTLDWLWPGIDNEADTASGVEAQEEAVYTLNFNIAAEQSGDAILPDGPAQTGDPAKISLALSIMTVCVVAMTVLVIPVLYERRDENE